MPKIYKLAELESRPHLAISLSAANDELRDKLMPINRRWDLGELMTAAKAKAKAKANTLQLHTEEGMQT